MDYFVDYFLDHFLDYFLNHFIRGESTSTVLREGGIKSTSTDGRVGGRVLSLREV